MSDTPWDGLNGSDVIAYDPNAKTSYIRLPKGLQRPIEGGCQCQDCKKAGPFGGFWDTLAVPKTGHAWTVHMPNPAEFREYLKNKYGKR